MLEQAKARVVVAASTKARGNAEQRVMARRKAPWQSSIVNTSKFLDGFAMLAMTVFRCVRHAPN